MTTTFTYDVGVRWTGERRGTLRSPGLPNLRVVAPPEFKGHEGEWTPEHMFVGAVVSCFMTTFVAIAELSNLDYATFDAEATGTLEKVAGAGFMITSVDVHARLGVLRPGDRDRAERILDKAEHTCLISNSIRSTVRLHKQVFVEESVAV